VVTSTTTDEGKEYIPGDLEINQQYLDFMKGIAPGMTYKDIEKLARLYPDPATNPDSPYVNAPNSTQYNCVGATWSDYAYICPSQETAYRVSESGLPVWKLRWDTNNKSPSWKGIPHPADMKYTWGEPTAQYPEIGTLYHAYLASFVATGNPNTRRLLEPQSG
jgi:acetylcholinesterase